MKSVDVVIRSSEMLYQGPSEAYVPVNHIVSNVCETLKRDFAGWGDETIICDILL